jgi:hypothetical protein
VLLNTGIKRICYEREYKLHTLEEIRSFTEDQVELVQVNAAGEE